jgi:hypothetical protein
MVGPHFSAGRAMLAPVHYDKSGPQPSILIEGASSKRSASRPTITILERLGKVFFERFLPLPWPSLPLQG